MNKSEKEVLKAELTAEEKELKRLKAIYNQAARDISEKIKIHNGKISVLLANIDDLDDTERSILQSQIYQRDFQKSLKQQIDGFTKGLNSKQYKSVDDYLKGCYQNGYIGIMYSLHKQGIPLVTPIDEKKVIEAMRTVSPISKNLYTKLGEDVDLLKKRIANNLSRGIAAGHSYSQIAQNIAAHSNVGFNRAARIARTEGHGVQCRARLDSMYAAKAKGADQVKQWDATLDGRTRDSHRRVDGELRELDEKFSNDMMMPSDSAGGAAEVVNCRCALLTRARWALDDEELQILEDRAAYFGLDKAENFEDFKQKYLKAAEVPKPKKEYLTEKKLKEKLADADDELIKLKAELQNDYLDQLSKYNLELEKVMEKPDIVSSVGSPEQYYAVKELVKKIDSIELQKIDWQTKLDKKIATKEIKKLKKEKIGLQDDLSKIQIKTYSGIWKDDVTTEQWFIKNGSVQSKKSYFENKLLLAADEAEKKKWLDLINQLEDFDKDGKKYYNIVSRIDSIDREIDKVKKGKPIKTDAFSDERKNAAHWFDRAHGGFSAADSYFDPMAKQIHSAASKREQKGFYTYTQGSGGHNRPLAGFQKPWNESGSGWEQQFYIGPKKVWIDFEGKGEDIRGLTTLIQKSTYDHDVWLQSGQEHQTIEGFLGIPYGTLRNMDDKALSQFVGQRNVIYNFVSTAVNEGGGSIFNSKPLKINFYAPEGTQMLYASDVGAFGKGENEMILQRGGTYEITRMYWGKDATDGNRPKIFVDMEIHPEEGYDLFQQDPNEWKGSKVDYKK